MNKLHIFAHIKHVRNIRTCFFRGNNYLRRTGGFMTTLGCNVNACSHNKDNCCCLSSIEVHGNSACKCDETCCGSFYEADSETAKNASESPKINLSISCEASNCVYNEDKKCSADHIDISGICAQDASETVCASFKCK